MNCARNLSARNNVTKEVYGGEVTTYAAQPDPERKPWRKRASVLDQAFAQELQKMEKELTRPRSLSIVFKPPTRLVLRALIGYACSAIAGGVLRWIS